MFKYYLIGNVYKDEYVLTNLINYAKSKEIFSDKPSNFGTNDINIINQHIYNNHICTDVDKYCLHTTYWDFDSTYRYPTPTNISIDTQYKYKLDELNLDKYLEQLKLWNSYYNNYICLKYENIQHYKKQHKLYHQSMVINHTWNRYDVFDTIETDREFRDNDLIKIDNKDYKVIYKYNKELSRHELYVDYDGIFEVDEKLKDKCELIMEELNFMIDKYNENIDIMEVIIDNRFEEYKEPEEPKKSLFKRFKEWIVNKIKHEC